MVTKIERVRAAFERKELDRIPMGEWGLGLSEPTTEELLAEQYDQRLALEFEGSWTLPFNKNNVDARNLLHHDLVNIQPKAPKPVECGYLYHGFPVLEDAVGGHIVIPDTGPMHVVKPVFASVDEVKSYKFPSIDSYDFSELRNWVEKSDFYVFGLLEGLYFLSYFEFFDYDYFFTSCLCDKKRINYWFEKAMDFYLELGMKQIDCGVHGIAIHDDHAFNSGPFLAPELFRELFFDTQKKQVVAYRDRGIEVGMHCDGNMEHILDYVVDMNYQAIQALQPSAGNNIGKIKMKYGDDLVLIGNIDNDLMLRGSVEEVVAVTKKTIDDAASGGGFILNSSCGLEAGAKTENVLAMYGTGFDYGKYR